MQFITTTRKSFSICSEPDDLMNSLQNPITSFYFCFIKYGGVQCSVTGPWLVSPPAPPSMLPKNQSLIKTHMRTCHWIGCSPVCLVFSEVLLWSWRSRPIGNWLHSSINPWCPFWVNLCLPLLYFFTWFALTALRSRQLLLTPDKSTRIQCHTWDIPFWFRR